MQLRACAQAAALAASAALAAPAFAAEAYVAYDNFPGSGPIDPAKWSSHERLRKVSGGTLNLVQRDWGGTGSDTGAAGVSFSEEIAAPGRITQLKGLVRVNAIAITNCAASTTTGSARARLLGSFFNTGNPTPGSQLGDVLAQVRIQRAGNSTDPEGVFRVQGVVNVCSSADCNFVSSVGTADLGTTTAGQQLDVAMEWQKAGRKFVFRRGPSTVGEVGYSVSDVAGPGRPLIAVGSRMDLPNCRTAPRTTGFVDASFDGIAINRTGRL